MPQPPNSKPKTMSPKTETRGRPRKFKDPTHITLRVESKDRAKWEAQAEREGQTLTDYITNAANARLTSNLTSKRP